MVNTRTANGQDIGSVGKDVRLHYFFQLRYLELDLLSRKSFPIGSEEPQWGRRDVDVASELFYLIPVNQVMPAANVSQPPPDLRRNNRTRDSVGQGFATIRSSQRPKQHVQQKQKKRSDRNRKQQESY